MRLTDSEAINPNEDAYQVTVTPSTICFKDLGSTVGTDTEDWNDTGQYLPYGDPLPVGVGLPSGTYVVTFSSGREYSPPQTSPAWTFAVVTPAGS